MVIAYTFIGTNLTPMTYVTSRQTSEVGSPTKAGPQTPKPSLSICAIKNLLEKLSNNNQNRKLMILAGLKKIKIKIKKWQRLHVMIYEPKTQNLLFYSVCFWTRQPWWAHGNFFIFICQLRISVPEFEIIIIMASNVTITCW